MFAELRAELDALGLTPREVELPGDSARNTLLEGALRLREDDGGFVLDTLDAGESYPLGQADSEHEASSLVVGYLSRPLPPVRVILGRVLDQLAATVAPTYFGLRDRARVAGAQGIVVDLPPDLPLDRYGALDGVHCYPIRTPLELRSLAKPETAGPLHAFVTTGPLRVSARITLARFGQPGGGLRFTLPEANRGLRDLVVAGLLQRIRVIG